ncbi:MAG: hypothetical protein ABFE13_14775 [Phycisphaerales bacterium]
MTWSERHAESERFAAEAECAVRKGDGELARKLYAKAAQAEVDAMAEIDQSKIRTLGVTIVSAAALWYKAGEFGKAEVVACEGLRSRRLPPFAFDQLMKILEEVHDLEVFKAKRINTSSSGETLVSVHSVPMFETRGRKRRMQEKRLKTYMTQVFFKCPGSVEPVPLERPEVMSSAHPSGKTQVFLFDDLLGGGIVVPEDIVRARLPEEIVESPEDLPEYRKTPGLLMLVTGAPGSGKTTFALELCYRLAMGDNSELDPRMKNGVSSIYISAEASADSVIQNATSYGWDNELFHQLPLKTGAIRSNEHRVFLLGRNAAQQIGDDAEGEGKQVLRREETPRRLLELVAKNWPRYYDVAVNLGANSGGGHSLPYIRPQVMVIDSFNTLGAKAPQGLAMILRECATRFLLTIAIVDTGPGISPEHRWVPCEYMADMEIDFSYDRPENYMIRRVWIVKARFQDHADGWHRMKINPKPPQKTSDSICNPLNPIIAVPNPLNPVIREGGIFVFPSVHRHLSLARGELDRAKAEGKAIPRRYREPAIETPFRALTDAIQGAGLPSGFCTSIVGDRGGMKSHLAYYTLLRFLTENREQRAVVISLRDTEDAAIDTLADILLQQVDDDGNHLVPTLNIRDMTNARDVARTYVRTELIKKDRLEILYFWPGYISPEEFFHLVCTSVDRPGTGVDGSPTPSAALLVINGLEQLSARFPLCAKESMFTSGLLSVLTVKGITVIVTSGGLVGFPADGGGVPAGLLPMSDLIIQTSFRLLPAERVWSSGVWFPTSMNYAAPTAEMVAQRERTAKGKEPHVIYEIIREPGARECRRRVLFYMGRPGDPQDPQDRDNTGQWRTPQTGFVHGSVYVRPLPDEFPHGERP